MARRGRLSLWEALAPGWPDDARLVVQERVFRRLAREAGFRGLCLNAGCGEGLYSPFIESFATVTGIVDVDLGGGPLPGDGRHRRAHASLTALPFPDATFDSCLCSEVLEHIEDDSRALAELARVLGKGGVLLLSVPTQPAPPDKQHVREGYGEDDLSARLVALGFDVLGTARSFHVFMRALAYLWEWQHVRLGRGKRSYFPRFLVRLFGHLDRGLPLGKPWDLALIARKRA